MANPDLPEEILLEIFSLLPAKSVGKCRCLSKSWRTLLSTPQFVKSHLDRRNTVHQRQSLLISHSITLQSIDAVRNNGVVVPRRIELPHGWRIGVAGSCDGLVLVLNHKNEIFLLNPVTLDRARVPDSYKTRYYGCKYGFGYDASCDDYKIVETCSYIGRRASYTFVDVYYVKRRLWKKVEHSRYVHYPCAVTPGAFLNGAIHYLACQRDHESGVLYNVIVAFDLEHDVFDEMPLPSGYSVGRLVFDKLVVFEGCLCVVDSRRNVEIDVWVMKEYGLAESWAKCSFRVGFYWDNLKPLCCVNNGEDVLVSTSEKLRLYNLKERALRDVVVDGGAVVLREAIVFVGSIVSPFFDT
ncbi:hypothetical protein ACP275_06G171300 [Erythranthe tilingii]